MAGYPVHPDDQRDMEFEMMSEAEKFSHNCYHSEKAPCGCSVLMVERDACFCADIAEMEAVADSPTVVLDKAEVVPVVEIFDGGVLF